MSVPSRQPERARNLRARGRLRSTWRGWGSLAVGLVALIFAYAGGRGEALVIAGVAFLLPLIGMLAVRVRRPRFEVVRLFSPPVVAAGDSATVTLRIRNTASGPSTPLVWNDALPWREDASPQPLDSIPTGSLARRTRVVTHDVHPPRRGVYAIGPLVVEHHDAFGMATSVAAVGHADQLVVVPAVFDLPPGGPTLADGEGAAQLVQRRVTGNDDDLTTREYRPGDALRRVHWRASARHGELMVRQEEHRSHPDARIVVDTRLRGYPDASDEAGETWEPTATSEAFEWVVRMAASLGMHLEASGFKVSIEESGEAQIDQLGERWEGSRVSEGFLASLAGVRLLDRSTIELSGQPPSIANGPMFALAADPEDATVEWLVRRRHTGEVAIAFLVGARPAVTTRLADAGWLSVPVRPDDEPGAAWRAASADAGYVRGAH